MRNAEPFRCSDQEDFDLAHGNRIAVLKEMEVRGIRELSTFSVQFSCELKTAVKKKKIIKRERVRVQGEQ